MKFVDEYRNRQASMDYIREIKQIATRPWTLMEICGGQTYTIIRYGLDQLLSHEIKLLHGPGCPVCVTPVELIDKATEIASRENVIFCSFADMLRVPGSRTDLITVKASGGDIRSIYSPMQAVKIAQDNPDKEVVFFAIGFETTAPGNAAAVHHASCLGLANFSVLVAHVLVPPAIRAILNDRSNSIDGFLAAGHVCTVMGYSEYQHLSEEYEVPIVITGFEPMDLLQGVLMAVSQLERGEARLENQYTRVVRPEGNLPAQDMIRRIFSVTDRKWRGLGVIPAGGLRLKEEYSAFDAEKKFNLSNTTYDEISACLAEHILRGSRKPDECPAFGRDCTPENPLGAPMVSSEGACASYYLYRDTAR